MLEALQPQERLMMASSTILTSYKEKEITEGLQHEHAKIQDVRMKKY